MPNATASRVRTYLDELERALSQLPKDRRTEIVRDIRGHIDVALAERGEPSAADVEQVLEELGTPQEIAEAAYAELPPPQARMAGRDIATIVLLLVGGFVFLIGWVVGVVLLWTSTAWRTKDKVIGTLLFPGGLLAPFLLLLVGGLVAVRSGGLCSTTQSAGAAPVAHCSSSSGGGWIGPALAITLLVVSFVGPIFSAVWLIRTARRVS